MATSLTSVKQHALKLERLTREIGFEFAALVPRHELIIEQLAQALSNTDCRPLRVVRATELPRVRELLQQLPQSAPIRTFLHATRNGLIKHVI